MQEMKRKSIPRMQEVEAPTERRVLIGCLETIASGTGISMHEIYGERERERKGEIRGISQRLWLIVLLTLTFTVIFCHI